MVHVNATGTIVFFEFHHKLDSVLAAKNLGYKTLLITKNPSDKAVESFDEVVECEWSKPGALLVAANSIKQKEKVKAVITNYEHFVVQRAWLSHAFGLPAPDMYAACATRNKALQRMALNTLPENIENVLVSDFKIAEQCFNDFDSDVFLKAIAGIKSRHVFHVKSKEQLKSAWDIFQKSVELQKLDDELYDDFSYLNIDFHYPHPAHNLLIEKACYGQQIAASSLILQNGAWHTPSFTDIYTAADIGREDSFLAFRILPSKHEQGLVLKVNDLVEKISHTLGLKSCAFFGDFLVMPDGELKIIEVASRIGGYRPMMYREVYGFDLTELLIKSLTGESWQNQTEPKKFVALCEFFPNQNGVLKGIDNLVDLKSDKDLLWINVKAQDGQEVGLAKEGYEPVLVALLAGESYEAVYEKSLYYQKNLEIKV